MPQKERPGGEKEQDQNLYRKNTEYSSGPVLKADEGIAPDIDPPAGIPISQLADLLGCADSDQQLAGNVISLQQSCGNACVQDILGHFQDSPLVPHQIPNDPVQIESSGNGAGISLKMSAFIKGEEDAEDEDETPLTATWTRKLGGLSDAIDPAVVAVNQQTVLGGATIPAGKHGFCEVTSNGDIQAVAHRGFFGTSYEVTATLDIRYNCDVQSLGKPDINGANSPEVTPDTWFTIVNDLTPSGESIPRSPRRTYWCRDLSLIHEQFHARDFTNAFNNFRPEEQAWLAGQTARSRTGAYNKGDQALLQLIARVTSYMGEGDFAPCEERAYGDGAPLYTARANDVQTRAHDEGWMTDVEAIMSGVAEEEAVSGPVSAGGEEGEEAPVCEEGAEWELEWETAGGPVSEEGRPEVEEEVEAPVSEEGAEWGLEEETAGGPVSQEGRPEVEVEEEVEEEEETAGESRWEEEEEWW